MQTFYYSLIISCILLFLNFQVSALSLSEELSEKDSLTSDGKRIYYTQRLVSSPPKIDGVLNDGCWDEGTWTGDYLQHSPVEGAKPSQPTFMKILYDNKNMYVAFRLIDNEPDKIDKQKGRRDEFMGDFIGVCFDSYHDLRTGFEFDISAGGTKMDILLQNDSWDTSWDAVWEGKVAHNDSGWTAEMKIPLSQLRYGNKEEHVWGLHSWRWINRKQEESNWDLIPRDHPGLLRSIGEIHGIKDIPKSRRIEILPYTVGKIKTYEKEDGNPYADGFDKKLAVGLDGKIGISSDFTVDFTINPDFGQVEADPAQLNLTAFETFYDEKRPFFLEGKNITDFQIGHDMLFYSRRIGQSPSYKPDLEDNEYAEPVDNTSIIGALKLTGKTKNGLSIGIINGLTAKETAKIKRENKEEKQTVEPMTNYFVGRFQKDINSGNTVVGGMLTSTNRFIKDDHLDILNRAANTAGVDFRHHWKDKTFFLDVKSVFSHVQGDEEAMKDLQEASAHYYQRPDADHIDFDEDLTSLSGHGGAISFGKRGGGKFRYDADFNWKSPGLDLNDIGYMRQADILEQGINLRYVVNEPVGRILEYSVSGSQYNNFTYGGEYTGSSVHFSALAKFKNRWIYRANYNRFGKQLDTRILRGGPSIKTKGFNCMSVSFQSDESKRVFYGLNIHAHTHDDKISGNLDISPNFTFKITNALKFSTHISYSEAKEAMHYISDDYDDEYFLAQLKQKTLGVTLRLDYAITPELTIQYYGNPYISVGEYSNFKIITDASAESYNSLYHQFEGAEMDYNKEDFEYTFSYNNKEYVIENPDFNFKQFRSNLVARWEYKTGSTLYFVWSHGRSKDEDVSNYSIKDNINSMFDIHPENIFLIKFNYWFSI